MPVVDNWYGHEWRWRYPMYSSCFQCYSDKVIIFQLQPSRLDLWVPLTFLWVYCLYSLSNWLKLLSCLFVHTHTHTHTHTQHTTHTHTQWKPSRKTTRTLKQNWSEKRDGPWSRIAYLWNLKETFLKKAGLRGSTNEQYWREWQPKQLCTPAWLQSTFFFLPFCLPLALLLAEMCKEG